MAGSELISLGRTSGYYTHSPEDAYLVAEGSVQVYIVPLRSTGEPMRQLPLRQVEEGHVIPAFCHKDSSMRQWRFMMTAAGDGEARLQLVRQGATTPLKRRFLQGADIDTWEQEGYEGSLLEYYHRT